MCSYEVGTKFMFFLIEKKHQSQNELMVLKSWFMVKQRHIGHILNKRNH